MNKKIDISASGNYQNYLLLIKIIFYVLCIIFFAFFVNSCVNHEFLIHIYLIPLVLIAFWGKNYLGKKKKVVRVIIQIDKLTIFYFTNTNELHQKDMERKILMLSSTSIKVFMILDIL